jgi:hypothetical protein
VEQSFETMWRMAKVAGGIDTTVKLIETVIETLPTFKFRTSAGKDMLIRDLAGLARSVQAATSVPLGASFDPRDVRFIEDKYVAVQTEMIAMLAELAKGAVGL